MRKSTFLKHINQLEEAELRDELSLLYDKVEEVRKYFAMELGSEVDRQKRYEKVKLNIKSKYATKSYRKPRRPRIQKIYKIIADVSKTSVFDFEMIDIYLFNAEEGVNFLNGYNYYSTPLFNSICGSFEKALSLINANGMEADFQIRCQSLINKARRNREIYNLLSEQYDKVFFT